MKEVVFSAVNHMRKSSVLPRAQDQDDAMQIMQENEADNDKTYAVSDEGEYYNFDNSPDVVNSSKMDDRLIYYDWVADSMTTSHVANRREIFTTYETLHSTTVAGVGDIITRAEGRGTVQLISKCKNHTYMLTLRDVLHIPTNRNNLLSLGQWEMDGR